MTKEQLIERLQKLPAGAEVRINQYEHDYTHARTAGDIRDLNEDTIHVNGFRGNADRIKDEEFDKDPLEKYATVYVLR